MAEENVMKDEDFDELYEKMLSEENKEISKPEPPKTRILKEGEDPNKQDNDLFAEEEEVDVPNKVKHTNPYFGDVSKTPFMDYIKEFNGIIIGDIKMLSDIKSSNKSMISLLSTRQRLLEDRHILANEYNKLNRTLKEQRGKEYEKIANSLKLRIKQKDDKTAIVAGVLSVIESRLKAIADQMEYIEGCIETINNIMHNVRYMIEINKMLGPNL